MHTFQKVKKINVHMHIKMPHQNIYMRTKKHWSTEKYILNNKSNSSNLGYSKTKFQIYKVTENIQKIY